MITILGPTASGKTYLAANLASRFNGEVISADSRQIFRGMDIGTGKDYDDYKVGGVAVPYHLIDIEEPGTEYNIFRYQQDFLTAWNDINARRKLPFLCGGSGMYLEAVLKGYRLVSAKPDVAFLRSLVEQSDEELELLLRKQRKLHNITDLENRQRMITALAIEHQARLNEQTANESPAFPKIASLIIGISFPRGLLKKRITERLEKRLELGMMEEIRHLISLGITPERLMRYGLEYKFGARYVTGEISREEMFQSLNRAVHQFAKRQMTWFRRMERNGFYIHWLDGRLPPEQMIEVAVTQVAEYNKSQIPR